MLSESPFFFFFSLENVAHTLKAFDSLLYQDEPRQLHKHFLAQLLKCILSRCMCVCVCVCVRETSQTSANLKKHLFTQVENCIIC